MKDRELVQRLQNACDDWDAEYDFGMIPTAVVRGIIQRYDEVSKLNELYYGAQNE